MIFIIIKLDTAGNILVNNVFSYPYSTVKGCFISELPDTTYIVTFISADFYSTGLYSISVLRLNNTLDNAIWSVDYYISGLDNFTFLDDISYIPATNEILIMLSKNNQKLEFITFPITDTAPDLSRVLVLNMGILVGSYRGTLMNIDSFIYFYRGALFGKINLMTDSLVKLLHLVGLDPYDNTPPADLIFSYPYIYFTTRWRNGIVLIPGLGKYNVITDSVEELFRININIEGVPTIQLLSNGSFFVSCNHRVFDIVSSIKQLILITDTSSWYMRCAKSPGSLQFKDTVATLTTLSYSKDTFTTSVSPGVLPIDILVPLYHCICPIDADFTTDANPFACEGDTVRFTNTGATDEPLLKYEWAFEGGTPDSAFARDPVPVVFDTAGYLTVFLNVSDGICSTSVQKTVDIKAKPVVSFNPVPDTVVCQDAPLDFQNTGSSGSGFIYQWDFGQDAVPLTSVLENPTNITWTSPGNKTVTLYVSNLFCYDRAQQTITVLPKPEARFNSPSQTCQYDTILVQYSGTDDGNPSFQWFFEDGWTPGGIATDSIDTVSFSKIGWKNINLVVTNSNGCTDSFTWQILVDSTPGVSFTSTAPVCTKTPVDFFNTGTSGSGWAYQWFFGPDANPQVSTFQNPAGVTFNSGGPKTIKLIIFNTQTGCSAQDTQTIYIHPSPLADAGPPDTTICFNDSVQIGSPPITGYSYQWEPPVYISSDTVSAPLVYPITYFSTYTVTVTDSNGCTAKDSIKIYMLDAISVDIGRDLDICRGDTVNLQATYSLNYAYSWTPLFNISDSVGNMVYIWPDTTTVYVVMAQDTSIYGCGFSLDSVVVRVHSAPALTVEPRGDTIAKGESIRLIASGAAEFQWFPDYSLDNSGIADPVASPDTTTVYVVRGTDVYGCYGYDTVVVYVRQPHVWVPDVFSPNGDGINDGVKVLGYGFVDYEFVIYDRFGNLVFYSQDPDQRWYGDGLNGEPCPEGAYSYYFVVTLSDGETIEGSGLINLVR